MLKTPFVGNASQLLLCFKTIFKIGYIRIMHGYWFLQGVKKVLSYPHINFYCTKIVNMNSQSDLFGSETSLVEMVGYAEA